MSRVSEQHFVPGGLVAGIRGLMTSLARSEQRVAKLVVDDPTRVFHLAIGELADEASTSTTTVMRFCRRLGFSGYHEFKLALARESMAARPQLQGDVTDEDDDEEILSKVVAAAADATAEAALTIDTPTFTRVADLLNEAERILVVGVGTSSPLAQDITYRFDSIGLRAEMRLDVLMQHSAASLLTRRDVCLAISHSGATRETMATVRTALATGAIVVGITSYFHSPLADLATIALVSGSKETSYRLEAMASRLAHLAILDAIYVAVAVRNRERTTLSRDRHAAVVADHFMSE